MGIRLTWCSNLQLISAWESKEGREGGRREGRRGRGKREGEEGDGKDEREGEGRGKDEREGGVALIFRHRYQLLLTVDDAGMVSVLRQNIRMVILFNPWCNGKYE